MSDDGKPRKFTTHEQGLVDEVLRHDGYALLMEYLQAESAMTINALARKQTSWEDTNYLRGVLAGLERFFPQRIQQHYTQSEKP